MASRRSRQPSLPQLLERKLYKAGQTRGADDDVIYQNRVLRSGTVLIPYKHWDQLAAPPPGEDAFANGFIALIEPAHYFGTPGLAQELKKRGLALGKNALVFYEQRGDWDANHPRKLGWRAASSRTKPLKGKYVARVAATTAGVDGGKISHGFNTTGMKGAGIRLFEYASKATIAQCRLQLEAIFWQCCDAMSAAQDAGMPPESAAARKKFCQAQAIEQGLFDLEALVDSRVINDKHVTICPLCLEPLSGRGFFHRLPQAMGRDVHNLTVTEVNLFHIRELRLGEYNHRPYNVGWGHHHCNVVLKDAGIDATLKWMEGLVRKNKDQGLFPSG